MTVAFDTLKAARRLRDEGGFDERQAAILLKGMDETLATKVDLEKTEAALRGQMRAFEQRMTMRLGGMPVGVVALIVAPVGFCSNCAPVRCCAAGPAGVRGTGLL